jgi:hypothetical protein
MTVSVWKCVLYYCIVVSTHLQLTNISYHAKIFKIDTNKRGENKRKLLICNWFQSRKIKSIFPTVLVPARLNKYIKILFNTFVRRSQGLKTKNNKISHMSCSVYTNRSLLIVCNECMLSCFFPRDKKWIISKGYVGDWNSTGYSQKYDGQCKYGLKCCLWDLADCAIVSAFCSYWLLL